MPLKSQLGNREIAQGDRNCFAWRPRPPDEGVPDGPGTWRVRDKSATCLPPPARRRFGTGLG